MFIEQPGLGHMKEIARTLAIESFLSGRVGILPPLLPNNLHNPELRQTLLWSTYYDWNSLPLIDLEIKARHQLQNLIRSCSSIAMIDNQCEAPSDLHFKIIIKHFSCPSIFGEWIRLKDERVPVNLREPHFSESWTKGVIDHVHSVIAEVGEPAGVIHIRRGDLASIETAPQAVIEYLHHKGVTRHHKIYVITNEKEAEYFYQLKKEFPCMVFEGEVHYLKRLAMRRPDNYLIFCIGKLLQSRYDGLGLGTLRYMRSTSPGNSIQNAPLLKRLVDILIRRRHEVGLKWLLTQLS